MTPETVRSALAALPNATMTIRCRFDRAPVIEEPRPGYRLAPFVGGPLHGQLRTVPEDPPGWRVAVPEPVSGPDLVFREVVYTRRRAWAGIEPGRPVAFSVFCTSDATENELAAVCADLICNGWQPA